MSMLSTASMLLSSACSVVPSSSRGLASASRPPNILLIVSDDQGYGDFGFTGNKIVKTPVLDRLSKEGAFYPHFTVAPACTPTRAALLTGRNHLDTGVWGVGSRGRVRRDEILMPKFFTPAGYQSWVFGKLDGGISMMEVTPTDRGFDWFVGIGGGYLHKRPMLGTPEGSEWTEGWTAELITDAAIEKVKETGDSPWVMLMAHIIPHLPWECPDSYADPYRKQGYSEDLAQCYGSIKQMDDQIGRLLDFLEESGRAENTIVLFMSDNGPVDVLHGRETGGWTNPDPSRPRSKDWQLRNPDGLIGRKGEVWDNGIRSPLLVRWPGMIKPGIREHAVGVEDILPTLLDLARIPQEKHPKHRPFAGRSFRASLEDTAFTDERDTFRLATGGPGTPQGPLPDARTLEYRTLHLILRSGPHKLHHLPGGKLRLYDMDRDPTEQTDLSKSMPELTAAMARRCREQWDQTAGRDRTFPMRQLVINNADHPREAWSLPVLQILRFEGEMTCRDFGSGVKGFRSPGDRADYTVDIQKPLTLSFVVEGKGFDQCAPISLLVDGKPVEAKSRSEDRIVFGPVALPAGVVPLSLAVSGDAEPGAAEGEVMTVTLEAGK